MSSRTETCKQDNEHGEEETKHGSHETPHPNSESSMASTFVSIDVVPNNTPGREVCSHNYKCQDPGDSGYHSGKQGTEDAGAEREQKGDESKSAGNWMKDLYACETISRVASGSGKVGVVD